MEDYRSKTSTSIGFLHISNWSEHYIHTNTRHIAYIAEHFIITLKEPRTSTSIWISRAVGNPIELSWFISNARVHSIFCTYTWRPWFAGERHFVLLPSSSWAMLNRQSQRHFLYTPMSDVIFLMTNGQSTVKRIIHLLSVYIMRRDCERYLYLVSPYNKLPSMFFSSDYKNEKDQNVELMKRGRRWEESIIIFIII